jgi:lipoyl(octanoyl) transferase
MRTLHAVRLGLRDYASVLAIQEELRDARLRNQVPDTLLLLEHSPVITLGRAARREHVLQDDASLRARGIDVHETGRGGDVTYHGPGQLVCYPILDLKPDRCDVRRYVRALEETMIRTCSRYGIAATRIDGLNGAWVENRKIGAVGVRIAQWVTMHGLALNANTALDAFDLIVPCGIRDKAVTSIARELGHGLGHEQPVDLNEVTTRALECFAEVLEYEVRERSLDEARSPS